MSDFGNMSAKYQLHNHVGAVEFGDDGRLFVEFSLRAVLDEVASREAARPVYRQVNYIRIRQPGERDEIMRPAHDGDVRRFPRHWEAFQAGRQDAPDGTPLVVLFPNNPEIVENLKYLKVFTVEQLAGLNDTQVQNVGMGARAWQQKAAELLMHSENGKGLEALYAKVEQMSKQMAALTEKNTALETALTEATEKKRGKAA